MSKQYLELKNFDDVFQSGFDFSADTFFVAYLVHKLLIGEVKDKQFVTYKKEPIEDKFLKELRIFNEKNELFVWKKDDILKARLWKNDDSVPVIEKEQVVWGTKSEASDESDFSHIFEDRGIHFYVPSKILQGKNLDDKKTRLKILTHSEIGYTDLGQATITDYKYIKFNIGG